MSDYENALEMLYKRNAEIADLRTRLEEAEQRHEIVLESHHRLEAENAALKEQIEILIEFIPKDFMMPLDWQSVVDKARKILDGGKDEAI